MHLCLDDDDDLLPDGWISVTLLGCKDHTHFPGTFTVLGFFGREKHLP